MYRPPIETNDNHEDFLSEAEAILNRLNNHKVDNKIVASDLNFGNCYCKFPILAPKPLDSVAPDAANESTRANKLFTIQ